MHRPPIVLDPQLSVVSNADFEQRRPELNVSEIDNVIAPVEQPDLPMSFITANSTWKDEYLDGLSPGDWVTSVGSGYETFPLDIFQENEIVFTNNPGVNAQQIGEHVFAMAFSYTRQLWTFRGQQRANTWKRPAGTLTDLAGDVCSIVGLGNIGEAVAKRASAFDMTVRGVKRHVKDYDGIADEVYLPTSLDDALDGAKLVILATPLTDETRHMIGFTELTAVSEDAILVNVARGPVLDTDALITALDSDELRAACLDVTDPEPLPPESPLWDRNDVLITPHAAGLSNKYTTRFLDRFLSQYNRWCNGTELKNRVV